MPADCLAADILQSMFRAPSTAAVCSVRLSYPRVSAPACPAGLTTRPWSTQLNDTHFAAGTTRVLPHLCKASSNLASASAVKPCPRRLGELLWDSCSVFNASSNANFLAQMSLRSSISLFFTSNSMVASSSAASSSVAFSSTLSWEPLLALDGTADTELLLSAATASSGSSCPYLNGGTPLVERWLVRGADAEDMMLILRSTAL